MHEQNLLLEWFHCTAGAACHPPSWEPLRGLRVPCILAHLCTLRSFSSVDNTTGAALARHLFCDDRDLLAAQTGTNPSPWHARRIKIYGRIFALWLRRCVGGEVGR